MVELVTLRTDADLYHASLFKWETVVFFRGVRYDGAEGFIETFTDTHVVINGQYYSRVYCEFKSVTGQ